MLTGERTALNFLQHLGGIATLTARYVAAVAGTRCRVLDTRKTLPGWRALAKYAVRCGGGHNHRMGLYDRIMLKDNHWAAGRGRHRRARGAGAAGPSGHPGGDRGGRPGPVRAGPGPGSRVDPAGQLHPRGDGRRRWARGTPPGRATRLEASGNVTLETIGAYARPGVDAASVGRLTHSAPALDLGLDLELSR